MRSIFLSFILMFVFGSCGTNETASTDPKNSESLIDSRFAQCYYEDDLAKNQSDSVLISILGKNCFNRSVRFELKESSMNCEVDGAIRLVPFGDTNFCVPNSYDLSYSLMEKNQPIFEFRMTAGKDMSFETGSTIVENQLRGYRKLMDGEFKLSYSEALKIAQANGVNVNESNLELVKNETSSSNGKANYHWEAELEYDHNSVVLLWIDVMTGATRKEILTINSID